MNYYWLDNWLDHHKVDQSNIRKLLDQSSVIQELTEVSKMWSENSPPIEIDDYSVFAGPGLDLVASCPHKECHSTNIGFLLRNTFLYYSNVILPDHVGRMLQTGSMDPSDYKEKLLDSILLHLEFRNTGINSFFRFFQT